MAGAVKPILVHQQWHTTRFNPGLTATNIAKPASFKAKEQVTVMIQASNTNTGTIYVSSAAGVTAEGATVGFELKAGEAVVLPLGDRTESQVWVIGTDAGDDVNCSFFNGGELC